MLMNRNRNITLALLVMFIATGLLLGTVPARGEDNKPQLVAMMKNDEVGASDGIPYHVIVDKLVTFDMSPELWQYQLGKNYNYRTALMSAAKAMIGFAKNAGWGDFLAVKGSETEAASMADSWKGKFSARLIVRGTLNPQSQEYHGAFDNFAYVLQTMERVARPRSGKAFVVVTIDRNCPDSVVFNLSPDGTTYSFQMRPQLAVTTSRLEGLCRKGN